MSRGKHLVLLTCKPDCHISIISDNLNPFPQANSVDRVDAALEIERAERAALAYAAHCSISSATSTFTIYQDSAGMAATTTVLPKVLSNNGLTL